MTTSISRGGCLRQPVRSVPNLAVIVAVLILTSMNIRQSIIQPARYDETPHKWYQYDASRATNSPRQDTHEKRIASLASPLVITSTPIPDVVQLSLGLPAVDPTSNITAALCCKAMFGNIDLTRVALWVAYYRLLGFEHAFLFHQDIVAGYPGYAELSSLPYVTLTPIEGNMVEFKEKLQTSNKTSIPYMRFGGLDNQLWLEKQCYNRYAKDYDWVMIADVDEFLSFNEEMGVKDFIANNTNDRIISLGFGKQMYTLTASVDQVDSGFGLDMYPFTPGVFCMPMPGQTNKRKECAGYSGSTKMIVRPHKFIDGINVHGPKIERKRKGKLQVNTDVARFFEYPNMHQRVNATHHEKEDFVVSDGFPLRMNYFEEAYEQNKNGTWTIRYDETPHKWYQYVASRATNSPRRDTPT